MSADLSASADPGLTDAVYRCVLEPEGWADVMAQVAQAFPSNAQAFYFLHRATGHLRPMRLSGIDLGLLPSLDALYFAPDNPCMWMTKQWHRPGVVRTNERMEAHLRRVGDLFRSAYYNEWMKPQGLHHMIGNTLVAEGELVANITLMRPRDMPTFDAAEVRRFERLTRHMARALQTGFALEARAAGADRWAALAALPGAVAVVDTDLRPVFANAAMDTLLRAGHTLVQRAGRLMAVDADAHGRLVAATRAAGDAPPQPVWLPAGPAGGVLLIDVTPVAARPGTYLPARRQLMLAVRRGTIAPADLSRVLRERHGCSRSEAALAVHLAQGLALQAAAAALGLTYGTARVYLKTLFQRLDVHSQAQLVAALARLGGG